MGSLGDSKLDTSIARRSGPVQHWCGCCGRGIAVESSPPSLGVLHATRPGWPTEPTGSFFAVLCRNVNGLRNALHLNLWLLAAGIVLIAEDKGINFSAKDPFDVSYRLHHIK